MKPNNTRKTIGTAIIAALMTGSAFFGGRICRSMVDECRVEGLVVKEYGKVQDGSYGFQMESSRGRTFYVNLSSEGKFGKETEFALAEAIKEGTYVRLHEIYESKDPAKDEKINAVATNPCFVDILDEGDGK